MTTEPDPAVTVAATLAARAVRWIAAKVKVEPVVLAGALRSVVATVAVVVASLLGVTIPPAVVAAVVAVLVATEALLSTKVRSAVTPNDRVAVTVDEIDEFASDDGSLIQ